MTALGIIYVVHKHQVYPTLRILDMIHLSPHFAEDLHTSLICPLALPISILFILAQNAALKEVFIVKLKSSLPSA